MTSLYRLLIIIKSFILPPPSNNICRKVSLGVMDAIKKKYLDRDIVPISSDPPTIEPDRNNLDRDNW